jgi:hypothetical protein
MPAEQISNIEVANLTKVASAALRDLSKENVSLRSEVDSLKEKVASFEKKTRAEKLAQVMEEKGINSEMSYIQKVSDILERPNLDVVEEALSLTAPQTKLASLHENDVEVESSGDAAADRATQQFAANLASLG